MGDKFEWKKIIQMVAIIGVLCIFVGIATRIMQKSQTSLSDYAKKNPETALAVPEKDEDEEEKEKTENKEEKDKDKTESKSDKNESKDNKSDKLSEEEQFVYDNFYYTEEEEGYKFRIAYYDSKHKVSTVEISSNVEDPDETLSFFYDMYKAEHEFTDIADIQKMLDRFAIKDLSDGDN